MTQRMPPIAIVGRGCVLPGALSPRALIDAVLAKDDQVRPVPPGRWGLDESRAVVEAANPKRQMALTRDRAVSTTGSYVEGFALDVEGLEQGAAAVLPRLDPLFQWVVHAGREALHEAGFPTGPERDERVGVILGNLSFPTEGMARFGASAFLEAVDAPWSSKGLAAELGLPPGEPLDRFMSGLPAHLTARALGLTAGAFCLDAACASSLYALRLAVDRLLRGDADVMLAGAVNRADNLFLHVGFTALQALSPSGQSRPFHKGADGLVPGEGAGVVALMTLERALAQGRPILGVLRGVGVSNDGRGRGLLAPSSEGQVRALKNAWNEAGLDPATVQLLECHATGTPMGDSTELETLSVVFKDAPARSIGVGSLKSNLGHLVTGAGIAGLLKVLGAFEKKTLPPSLHTDDPIETFARDDTPFRLLSEAEPWKASDFAPRRAAVSAFGFGGNNAHVVVEAWDGDWSLSVAPPPPAVLALDVAGLGARAAGTSCAADLVARLDEGAAVRGAREAAASTKGLRFPPNDLLSALPQQIMVLEAAREAVVDSGLELAPDRTAVLVGMGTDSDITSPGVRWRLAQWGEVLGDAPLARLQDAVIDPITAQGVLGRMPNIPANRLNVQLDCRGPGFTVSGEELSGLAALDVARDLLERGGMDAVIVGAVDVFSDVRDHAASRALGWSDRRLGDAAVALVVTRAGEAPSPLARLDAVSITSGSTSDADVGKPALAAGDTAHVARTERVFGHAHAAAGLLEVAAAAIDQARGKANGTIEVEVAGLGGAAGQVRVSSAGVRSGWPVARPSEPPLVAVPMRRRPPAVPSTGTADELVPAPKLPLFPPVDVDWPPPPREEVFAAPPPALAPPGAAHKPRPNGTPSATRPASSAPPSNGAPKRSPSPAPAPAASPPTAPASAPMAAAASSTGAAATATIASQALPPAVLMPPAMDSSWDALTAARADLVSSHRSFLENATRMQQAFLAHRQALTTRFAALAGGAVAEETSEETLAPVVARTPTPVGLPARAPPAPQVRSRLEPFPPIPPVRADKGTRTESPRPMLAGPPPSTFGLTVTEGTKQDRAAALAKLRAEPWIDRKQLERLAGGRIADVLGPAFDDQAHFVRQVRMPDAPLLLCDRVLTTDAKVNVLERGRTMWTETDVSWDKWYLHLGRIPPGVLIESGQADLLLISMMGVDADNRGGRVYRLLGCDLTYRGPLPQVGDVLHYDIHIDGFANHGATRLFFFHSDTRIGGPDGELVLSVRGGQAGFFTDEELAGSGGILWTPDDDDPSTFTGPVDAPAVPLTKAHLGREELEALASGDALACFGPGFEGTRCHVRTPSLQGGDMLLLDRVTTFDPRGGPWGRGYLRAEFDLYPERWFFDGHFKDDPCMPGTLMFEGCLQCLDLYLLAMGFGVDKDGYRFEPVANKTFPLRCRGQAIPSSRDMVYEVFVKSVRGGPEPSIIADLVVTVDGLKGLHAKDVEVRMVPDWPLISHPELIGGAHKHDGTDGVGGVPALGQPEKPSLYNQRQLLASAWGKPSEAFGEAFARFDGNKRAPRLPGPPYHCMRRVTEVTGPPPASFKPGNTAVVEYDVPPDAWYFGDHGHASMPFSVLLETALQPCGWLATYAGSTLQTDEELYFRNLDGDGLTHRAVPRDVGTLTTRATLQKVSRAGGMIIEVFDVELSSPEGVVFTCTTSFGFFPERSLAQQVGVGSLDAEKAALVEACAPPPGMSLPMPFPTFGGPLPLAGGLLHLLDRVTGWWPTGGSAGLGRVRAEKDIEGDEWFFKAHFFQDPVQPGSLGLEAVLQAARWGARATGRYDDRPTASGLALPLGEKVSWRYRGQVLPKNKRVVVEVDLLELRPDAVIIEAWLWVDGLRIYHAPRLGFGIV